jgi:large subunit ribosomal protein L16
MRFVKKQKQTDWKKLHRSMGSSSFRDGRLVRSRFALLITSYGLITRRQFEAIRRFIARRIRKRSKYLRRATLDTKLTRKSKGARMGKGAGRFYRWVGYLRPGTVLYEINTLRSRSKTRLLRDDFYYLASKLPFKVRFVQRSFSYNSHTKGSVR